MASTNNQGSRGNNQRGNNGGGFGAMDPQQQREIAAKGGRAVSENREHMSEIGRRGGEASHGNRGGRGGNDDAGKRGDER